MAGWELSPEAVHAINELRNLLDDEYKELNSRYEDRPLYWQDSSEGVRVGRWLEDVWAGLDALREIDTKPPEW